MSWFSLMTNQMPVPESSNTVAIKHSISSSVGTFSWYMSWRNIQKKIII